MSYQLLEKLCYKLSEFYDKDLSEELTDICTDLIDEIKEDEHKYFDLVRKLAELQVKYENAERERKFQERVTESHKTAFNVAKNVYEEERKLREKIEKEKDQIEYDKDYFANLVKEIEAEGTENLNNKE